MSQTKLTLQQKRSMVFLLTKQTNNMNTTDKNQFIEQIQNWQQADPENRTSFVVLIEDDNFSSTIATDSLNMLKKALVSIMAENEPIANIITRAVSICNLMQKNNYQTPPHEAHK